MKWERVKVSESHTLTRERGREREGKSNLCTEEKGDAGFEVIEGKQRDPRGEVGETMRG